MPKAAPAGLIRHKIHKNMGPCLTGVLQLLAQGFGPAAGRASTGTITDNTVNTCKLDFTKWEEIYKETQSQGHHAALHHSEFLPPARPGEIR